MNGYKSPSGTTDNNDGGVNNLSALSQSAIGFKSKSAFCYPVSLKQSAVGFKQSAIGFKQSAIGFKSKSAFSMRLLMTLFKDREKNEIVWQIICKTDFNSKADTVILMVA